MNHLYDQLVQMVPVVGHEILKTTYSRKNDGERAEGSFVVEKVDFECEARPFAPLMEHTGLFREFADMHPLTPEKAIAFADKFGTLGAEDLTFKIDRAIEGGTLPGHGLARALKWHTGERLSAWDFEVAAANHIVELMDLIRSKDVTGLSRFITWSEDGQDAKYRGIKDAFKTITSAQLNANPASPTRTPDVIRPAMWAIQTQINLRLKNYVSKPKLLWDSQVRRLTVRIIPENLISAIWLQIALAVEGNKDYRQCSQCQRWFEVGGDHVREDAKYCQQSCRSKAYRERQKKARELAKSGMKPREIAEQLDSDIKAVKGWIKQ